MVKEAAAATSEVKSVGVGGGSLSDGGTGGRGDYKVMLHRRRKARRGIGGAHISGNGGSCSKSSVGG